MPTFTAPAAENSLQPYSPLNILQASPCNSWTVYGHLSLGKNDSPNSEMEYELTTTNAVTNCGHINQGSYFSQLASLTASSMTEILTTTMGSLILLACLLFLVVIIFDMLNYIMRNCADNKNEEITKIVDLERSFIGAQVDIVIKTSQPLIEKIITV
jgi:hypothetical protein